MGYPVVLKNLSKRFSSPHNPEESCLVVDRINLELKEGELLTLVGPRGCGKSTILKMIAGLEHPTEGEIYVDSHMVDGVPPQTRNVGFLVPGTALFEHMTVADNISVGFKVRKILNKDSRRHFEQLVTLMGLEDVLDRTLDQLSRVQQRRVALARVLAPQPRVLLLDDPFADLDTSARQQLREDTKLWQRVLNIPTILATQDRFEALEMGERIAILDEGRFQQIDSCWNLFSNPANAFVAHFIGSENIYSGNPDDRLNGTIGTIDAVLPGQAGNLLALSIDGNRPSGQPEAEDDHSGSAFARNTFLGRPIRLEVGHKNKIPST